MTSPAAARPQPLHPLPGLRPPRVALLRLGLGDDSALLEWSTGAYDGIVVEAFGGGHVPASWVEPLLAAARTVPVVLASRVGTGALLRSTYDFPGSEQTLAGGALLWAGELDGLKARILLMVVLMVSRDRGTVRGHFTRLSAGGAALRGEDA